MQIGQGLDWGTVPAWFSAVLGGLSTTLALYIIWRDRRKEERADAHRVICWESKTTPLTAHVVNASDRAIYDVRFWVTRRVGNAASSLRGGNQDVLKPGEEAILAYADPEEYEGYTSASVTFQDSDGQNWTRSLSTRRLQPLQWSWTRRASDKDLAKISTVPERRGL